MRKLFKQAFSDDGFTIVEAITAIAVIAVVLTSTTALYVRSMVLVDEQGTRQTALQVATDGMETFRGVSNLKALGWLQTAANANYTKTVNNTPFTVTWRCATGLSTAAMPSLPWTLCYDSGTAFVPVTTVYDLLYAQLTVTWNGRTCPTGGCTYGGAITEVSTAQYEPTFDTTS